MKTKKKVIETVSVFFNFLLKLKTEKKTGYHFETVFNFVNFVPEVNEVQNVNFSHGPLVKASWPSWGLQANFVKLCRP